jgi:hypothetical protein
MRTLRSSQPLWAIPAIILMAVLAHPALAAPDAAMFARCAKACRACMAACRTCTAHCDSMVKAGMKEHQRTARISADCRDLCDVAAKLTARKGPMSVEACKACLGACNACGKECRKYPKMKQMVDCAKACDACEKACQEMIDAAK